MSSLSLTIFFLYAYSCKKNLGISKFLQSLSPSLYDECIPPILTLKQATTKNTITTNNSSIVALPVSLLVTVASSGTGNNRLSKHKLLDIKYNLQAKKYCTTHLAESFYVIRSERRTYI